MKLIFSPKKMSILMLLLAICLAVVNETSFRAFALQDNAFLIQTSTGLHETGDNFAFRMRDWDGDGTLDLLAIKQSDTGTNSTEIHIYSGADNFQTGILHTGSGLHETDETFAFDFVDWNSDGILDLVALKKSNTETNSTEVHIYSGATNFQEGLLHSGSGLPETDETFAFAFVDWNNDGIFDLVGLKKSNTSTNSTEVHIFSGASNFVDPLLQLGTALGETDDTFAFDVVDWNGDDQKDVVVIKKSKTGSNSTEVHILNGAF